ncbi:MAG: WecB/TagA/CpsF family glycosyltransferase [Candidatus Komeilibacteria bacterium]
MFVKIAGTIIDNISIKEALEKINYALANDQTLHIVTINPEFIVLASKNIDFQNVVNEAEIRTADGFGLILFARLILKKKLKRAPGSDLTNAIFANHKIASQPIFLLGGREGVAYSAAKKIKAQYPDANIVGTDSGFNDIHQPTLLEYNKIIDKIDKSGAKILLVAYNAPFAQLFIKEYLPRFQNIQIAMGIGGALDFWTNVKRAPKIMRIIGLEWMWRLILQPWRLPRIYKAIVKFWLLANQQKDV